VIPRTGLGVRTPTFLSYYTILYIYIFFKQNLRCAHNKYSLGLFSGKSTMRKVKVIFTDKRKFIIFDTIVVVLVTVA